MYISALLSTWTGGGYVECPHLSTRGGEGVKIGSKLVHVVVECPLRTIMVTKYNYCISLHILRAYIHPLYISFFPGATFISDSRVHSEIQIAPFFIQISAGLTYLVIYLLTPSNRQDKALLM